MSRWLCWLGGIAFCALAHAASLPVSDFVRNPTLTNPVLSPDGQHLAVVFSKDADGDDPHYQLAFFHLPDLKPVSLLSMEAGFVPMDVHWVNDTRVIMALAQFNGTLESPSATGDILAVNYDGTRKKVLYSIDQERRGEATGTRLAGQNYNIANMPIGIPWIGGVPLRQDGHFYLMLQVFGEASNFTSWDAADSRVYDVDADSGQAVQVGGIGQGGLEFLVHDGVARIAYGQDGQNKDVAFMSSDGRHWTPLAKSAIGDRFQPLRIDADGEHLYALSSMNGEPEALVECNLDGSDRKVLASDTFASVSDVLWTPDANMPFAAVFHAAGIPRVHYIGDGPYARILQALAKTAPGEFVTVSGYSSDGKMLLVHVQSDRDPGVYALFDRATMHAQPLYRERPWIDPASMPARTPVRFKNRDGVELAGFLTLPNGGNRKNLPLVLIPHGGPIGPSDDWFFDPWAALLANRGYATLQVNYRGSGGRGNDFERAGFRQFASGIQDDLIDGVKWTIAQGYADPDRICVFGASFGGYSSLMQPILAPRLYKCAIDYAGVYDWRIDFDRSDTRRYEGGRTYLADAIGTRDDALAMSPASMMDKFNVPVLIAHGKDDPRVPYRNATDLRSALDKSGKPYEWLAEPKELHGFASEEHNEELWNMILPFLGKYIGAGDAAAAAAASK
jgi:dipeptidyl aminopeptidase/acylaminoacyl peptidase